MPKAQRVDATSAEDKSIGFDYQYYYFLNQLLNLKTGMTVGLEVMDDVHTELDNDTQVLVQLKHTTQTKVGGGTINLTTMDGDLWKSLSNWSKVIMDPEAGRTEIQEQLAFTERTKFLLASNKSENESNLLLKNVRLYQKNEISHNQLRSEIEEIRGRTKSEAIKGYINNVLSLPSEVSEKFFKHMNFDLGCDDIIESCKRSIREKQIADNRVDEVFWALDSEIRSDNFDLVKSKKKIVVSFDDFRRRYRLHFDKARNERLEVRNFTGIIPEKMDNQVFIRQLVDIGDFDVNDVAEITRLTTQLLMARNNMERWLRECEITNAEVKDLEGEMISTWRNKFKKAYRASPKGDEIFNAALNIVDTLREKPLFINDQGLGTPFSNGLLYDLSDRPEIGWLHDWEDRYK